MKTYSILAIIVALATPAFAETLEGDATCAKCGLKTATACQLALTVSGTDGKKATYLAEQNDVAKGFHSEVCQDTKKVKAEGTLAEKDGKKVLTLSKIEVAK
jgi:hypothetical protein